MIRPKLALGFMAGLLMWAQNVGIGTSNPSERLHVEGNFRLQGAFMPNNQAGSVGSLLYSNGPTNPPVWLSPPTNASQVLGSTASGSNFLPTWTDGNGLFWRLIGNSGTNIASNFIGTTDNVGLAFRTNNTERMRITTDGNIGINTPNPEGRLDVRQPSDNEVALFTTYGAVNRIFLRRAQGTISAPTATTASEIVLGRIDAQGYNGSTFTSAARIEMTTDAAGGNSTDMPGRITFHTTPDGSGTLVERMRITNAGNVGIGTSDPQVLLEVFAHQTGNTAIGGRIRLSANGDGGRRTYLDFAPWRGRPGGPAAQIIGEDDNNASAHLRFYTAPPGSGGNPAPQERMRIQSTGEIFGRFRHISYHKFHNQSWTGNPANTILWIASPGGDATDDWQVNGALPIGGPGFDTEAEAQWVAPYNGHIVRVIIRVGNPSGSTPTIRTRGLTLSRNGTLYQINTSGFCLNSDEFGVYPCTQNCEVQRGDRIGIGLDLRNLGGCCGGSCYAEDTHYWVAVVWEFDIWD
ncbi:MAG: hypothetical protein RMK98_06140 [Bacteroidia bacterium]|nr:hypothetical protein [Bacteroidia bacterium]